MTGWLVDTKILSALRGPRSEGKVVGVGAAQAIETRDTGDHARTGVPILNPRLDPATG